LFTVLVKLAMSITYKPFLSQAKNESIETWNQWAREKFKRPNEKATGNKSFIIKQVWILWLVAQDWCAFMLCFNSSFGNKFQGFRQMIYPLWLYLWVTNYTAMEVILVCFQF
jgi:hypothetical protein